MKRFFLALSLLSTVLSSRAEIVATGNFQNKIVLSERDAEGATLPNRKLYASPQPNEIFYTGSSLADKDNSIAYALDLTTNVRKKLFTFRGADLVEIDRVGEDLIFTVRSQYARSKEEKFSLATNDFIERTAKSNVPKTKRMPNGDYWTDIGRTLFVSPTHPRNGIGVPFAPPGREFDEYPYWRGIGVGRYSPNGHYLGLQGVRGRDQDRPRKLGGWGGEMNVSLIYDLNSRTYEEIDDEYGAFQPLDDGKTFICTTWSKSYNGIVATRATLDGKILNEYIPKKEIVGQKEFRGVRHESWILVANGRYLFVNTDQRFTGSSDVDVFEVVTGEHLQTWPDAKYGTFGKDRALIVNGGSGQVSVVDMKSGAGVVTHRLGGSNDPRRFTFAQFQTTSAAPSLPEDLISLSEHDGDTYIFKLQP